MARAGKAAGKLTALAVDRASKPGLFNDYGCYLKIDDSAEWRAPRFRWPLATCACSLTPRAARWPCKTRPPNADACCSTTATTPSGWCSASAVADPRPDPSASTTAPPPTSRRTGWHGPAPKHASEWAATLQRHVSPVFGSLAVADIDTPLVVRALDRIWKVTPETASSRVRQRIETVLNYAKANETAAARIRRREELDDILPPHSKIKVNYITRRCRTPRSPR